MSCHRHTIGLTRRELLQVGYSGLIGCGLPSLFAARRAAAESPRATGLTGRAKSVIIIFLTGAPSHLDTFDLKPESPTEVRGDFRPIATSAPGVEICEHLPGLAARAHQFAIVRSMTHGFPSHEHATHMVLTGIDKMPPGATHMASRHDWPCYASGFDYLRRGGDGVPSGVMLPTYLNNGYGFSGQSAGLLGATYDPWQITQDPNDPNFRIDILNLPIGLTADQIVRRQNLLAEIDRQRDDLAAAAQSRQYHDQQHQAMSLLTSGKIAGAFSLEREPAAVRDRYGRHLFGQSLLLARRLAEAGVPVVQANMGRMNNWDTHNANCKQLKERLLPPLDQALSALLDDCERSGLLDETLIVMLGEFGRTPQLGGNAGTPSYVPDGRDHWAGVFFAVFAGAGVQGGQVIGKSDKIAAYPATRGYYPSDLGATVYSALGIPPDSELRDREGRPIRLNAGAVIDPLFSGA